MKRCLPVLLVLCLLLSGCTNLLDGNYHSVRPHEVQGGQNVSTVVSAENYEQLRQILVNLARNGVQSQLIFIPHYNQSMADHDVRKAAREVMVRDPIAAFAVEEITYELGTSNGQAAVSVTLKYLHARSEIQKIQKMKDMESAKKAVASALDSCENGVVLHLENYEAIDFVQFVENYAAANPQKVMETPRVTAKVYPNIGQERVVELRFSYQNSREDLRQMQEQVRPVFSSAVLYASGAEGQQQKYTQLYAFMMEFLMEHNDYKLQTSITPAYSLLCHSVGDSKAFATVYAAMCAEVGLECRVIAGTRRGESWAWNQVCVDGNYYHVDLLQCGKDGAFRLLSDGMMDGYVWNYSAYPKTSG